MTECIKYKMYDLTYTTLCKSPVLYFSALFLFSSTQFFSALNQTSRIYPFSAVKKMFVFLLTSSVNVSRKYDLFFFSSLSIMVSWSKNSFSLLFLSFRVHDALSLCAFDVSLKNSSLWNCPFSRLNKQYRFLKPLNCLCMYVCMHIIYV